MSSEERAERREWHASCTIGRCRPRGQTQKEEIHENGNQKELDQAAISQEVEQDYDADPRADACKKVTGLCPERSRAIAVQDFEGLLPKGSNPFSFFVPVGRTESRVAVVGIFEPVATLRLETFTNRASRLKSATKSVSESSATPTARPATRTGGDCRQFSRFRSCPQSGCYRDSELPSPRRSSS